MSSLPMSSDSDPHWEIATFFPLQGTWSEEEYLELSDSTNRLIEFTNGNVEFLAMPTEAHQLILMYLMDVLRAFAEPDLGKVLFAGLRVRTSPGKYREPDLVFLSKENYERRGNRYWKGADLAMEVVSEDSLSRDRDYQKKVIDYAEAGIPEYWIVDPQEKQITVLSLPEGSDTYQQAGVYRPGQLATSVLLEGFTVEVDKVFAAGEG